MPKRLLPLVPHQFVVEQVTTCVDRITVVCRSRSPTARCPTCRTASRRMHSHYRRCFGDLPWQGRPVTICLLVRRLRCANQHCGQRIFAERTEAAIGAHARRTVRLGDIQRSVGLALGGEAGARLVERLGMPVSAATLLRLVRAGHAAVQPTPRHLGVDDWAWRRGKRYGTVLIDLEGNHVVDLLPDRDGDTLSAWLKAHPGVEIIARDRAGAYARGAREGAPEARQVADRWHILRNCSDTLLNVVEKQYRLVREIGRSLAYVEPGEITPLDERIGTPGMTKAALKRQQDSRQRRKAMFDRVADFRAKGWNVSSIARETGLDRKTIRQWLVAKQPGLWEKPSRHHADAFDAYVRQRWNEGCRNATQLFREVSEMGYHGDAHGFRHWVRIRLRDGVAASSGACRKVRLDWKPPSPRQALRLLVSSIDTMPPLDRQFVASLRSACPEVATAADLAQRFHALLVGRDIDALDPWLAEAATGSLAPFARGLLRDIDAVRAALTLPWSTGPVEGKINKLKLIKRSMYGRAGLDLLRARIMA